MAAEDVSGGIEPTLALALRRGADILRKGGSAAARLEAELLLCKAAGLARSALYAWPERHLSQHQTRALDALLRRRAAGEPIAYILGEREFWSLPLRVTPATLIPRPETELLVQCTLATLPTAPLVCADLGTGSGAVAVALASERAHWTLIAVDRSVDALQIAATNARALAPGNLLPMAGDWLSAFAAHSLDAVVANPPYVPDGDPHLAEGDLRFEPPEALAAGPDGLDAIRKIVKQASTVLRPGGWLAIEHGYDQGTAVRALYDAAGFSSVRTLQDLAGNDRVTAAEAAAA